jgi:hypothetical protein
MEISANYLIYDILEIASSGGNPNEFKISNEQILYWIEQTRAILIGQSLNKRDDINDTWVQYINCLEMEPVDASLCCLAPSDCKVTRSVQKLPSTIDTWRDNWIISVSGMDGNSIPKSNPIKQKYQKYNKYTKNDPSWCVIDDYLYIINDVFLEKLRVGLLAEFPSDLARFVDCTGEACFSLDSNYPISISMASQITDIIVKTKVQPFINTSMNTHLNMDGATPTQERDSNNTK